MGPGSGALEGNAVDLTDERGAPRVRRGLFGSAPRQRASVAIDSRLALLPLLVAIACAPPVESPDGRPLGQRADIAALGERDDLNVLFILIDTLRADRLGAYGYDRPTSPNLDALATSGVRFARHLSQSSWTKASMASLWTSLYPSRNRVLRHPHVVPAEARLPAEILRDAGFRTAGLWRNGWIAPNFGFDQGFEIYHSPSPQKLDPRARAQSPGVTIAGSDADIIRSAIEFLRVHRDERWFLYLHMMDVHQYVSSEETAKFGTSYSDLYDNAILWDDSLVGHLVAELDELGLRDRTLIVLASDHGEAFGEHGGEGHARNVYREVVATPVILSLPFALSEPAVVESVTENVDLWPSILDLIGVDDDRVIDGHSRVSEMAGTFAGERTKSVAELDTAWARTEKPPALHVALASDQWRYVHWSDRPEQGELYDLSVDPGEQHDVAAAHPEVVAKLRADVEAHLTPPPAPWGDSVPVLELDEMQLNQLRALGYGVE